MKFKDIINTVLELDCFDAYCLADRLGIDLVYDNDMLQNEPAKLVCLPKHTMLYLNETLGTEEEYLIYHEIGHYVLHSDQGINKLFNNRRLEYEANMFASLCLVHADLTADYYSMYLISKGVPQKIALDFHEAIYQYKQTELFGDCWKILECWKKHPLLPTRSA